MGSSQSSQETGAEPYSRTPDGVTQASRKFTISPITALFWTAVINGLLAPPLLVVLMLITNNPRIMGAQVNGRLAQGLGWLTAFLMLAAALGMLLTGG